MKQSCWAFIFLACGLRSGTFLFTKLAITRVSLPRASPDFPGSSAELHSPSGKTNPIWRSVLDNPPVAHWDRGRENKDTKRRLPPRSLAGKGRRELDQGSERGPWFTLGCSWLEHSCQLWEKQPVQKTLMTWKIKRKVVGGVGGRREGKRVGVLREGMPQDTGRGGIKTE